MGIEHVEGPNRYTAKDVAAAFARAMGQKVAVQEIPRDALDGVFRQSGFSAEAAASYACMARRLIDGKADTADQPIRDRISLESYVASVLG